MLNQMNSLEKRSALVADPQGNADSNIQHYSEPNMEVENAEISEPVKGRRKRWERQREDLTQPELERLLKASRDKKIAKHPERDYCMLLLIARHGLRVQEALNLKVSDVDFEDMQLNFKRVKQWKRKVDPKNPDKPVVKKNGKSDRHPLYDREIKAIRDWLVAREKMSMSHMSIGAGDSLFISERRTALSRSMVHHLVQTYAKAAGLEDLHVHIHMLRHSCGHDLANRGVDTLMIKNFLGHSNIQNTMRYTERAGRKFEILYNDKRTLRR
jgi:integrase